MSLEEVKKALSENSELVAYVEGLSNKASNVDTLTNKVNEFENKFNDAVSTRDKAKANLSLVKNTFGLEEITEEALSELKNSKNGKGDEKLLAEIDNLRSQMSTNDNAYKEDSNKLINEIRELRLGSQLSDLIATSNIIDDQTARKDAMNAVKSMMSFNEKNEPIFLKEDGTTRFNANGGTYSMQDAINDVLQQRPYLMARDTKSGGDSRGNSGGGATASRAKMTNAEKGAYIKEHGNEAYLKLPK